MPGDDPHNIPRMPSVATCMVECPTKNIDDTYDSIQAWDEPSGRSRAVLKILNNTKKNADILSIPIYSPNIASVRSFGKEENVLF